MTSSGRQPGSPAPAPGDALRQLAATVSAEGPPLRVVSSEPDTAAAFGMLASAGPRTAAHPDRYAFVVEAVREGYLCHYESPRILDAPDSDLALLAGDLLYAIGISALAELGDVESVRLLSDLIRVSAELRSASRADDAEAVWLASILALACGSDDRGKALVAALERDGKGARRALESWVDDVARANGISRNIGELREAIHFAPNP